MTIEPKIRFLPDDDNPRQVQWNGLSVHSRNPVLEAKRQADSLLGSTQEAILCFGPGLGYLIDELINRTQRPILWIEEHTAIREAALHRLTPALERFELQRGGNGKSGPISTWLFENRPRLILYTYTPSLQALRKETGLPLRSFAWSTNRATLQPSYLSLIGELDQAGFRETVNKNTLLRFDRLWVKNTYYNFAQANRFREVEALSQKFRGIPAVVASAGPSLDSILPLLDQYRNRFLLIAVDTALAPLRHAGIDPDYAVAVDAQPANFLHSRSYTGQADFVIDPTLSYLALRHLRNPVYVFDNRLPLVTGLFEIFSERSPGELRTGGSVSTNAWDLALKMGCSPIYLCGLDLSFPGHHIHATGSALEEAVHSKTSRFSSIEQHNYNQLTAIETRFLPGKNRLPVRTNDKLRIFHNWYARRFQELSPDVDVRNVYGGGANFPEIPSLEHADFKQDLQALPERAAQVYRLKAAIRESSSPGTVEVSSTIRSLEIQLEQLGVDIEKLLEIFRTTRDPQTPSTISDLENIEAGLINNSGLVRMLSNGMQRTLINSANENDPDHQTDEKFYQGLLEACRFHLRLIRTAFQSIQG